MNDKIKVSGLQDKYGSLIGFLEQEPVLFDEFKKNSKRKSHNIFVQGDSRTGKTILIKKRFYARSIRSDRLRTLDIHGDYAHLTNEMLGKNMLLDGTEGMINPLQIFQIDVDVNKSFLRHMEKLDILYCYWNDKADENEIILFEEIVKILYKKFTIITTQGKVSKKADRLPAEKYPTLTDCILLIENMMVKLKRKVNVSSYKELNEILALNNIRNTLVLLLKDYSNVFDGHTTLNINNEQIVNFNLCNLCGIDGGVFGALAYNLFFYCWHDQAISDLNERSMIIMDNASYWFNTKNLRAVEQIMIFLQESADLNCSLVLNCNLDRYMREDTLENRDELKKLISMFQYHFIFRENAYCLDILEYTLKDFHKVKKIQDVTLMKLGQAVLNIENVKNIFFQVNLTNEEKELFGLNEGDHGNRKSQ